MAISIIAFCGGVGSLSTKLMIWPLFSPQMGVCGSSTNDFIFTECQWYLLAFPFFCPNNIVKGALANCASGTNYDLTDPSKVETRTCTLD